MSRSHQDTIAPVRALAEQAFSRAAGAPLVPGNHIRLLKDARENYPAWLDAIARAARFIHFESHIIHDDAVSRARQLRLDGRIRQDVASVLEPIAGWRGRSPLLQPAESGKSAGLAQPGSSQDARRGRHGWLVTGLCVGQAWVGDPARGIAPWRGARAGGAASRGGIRADGALIGEPLSDGGLGAPDAAAPAGETALRVVATVPNTAGLLRLGQLVAALVQKRLWLTDAYYAGTPIYVQALRSAAQDGVDVRLLVPNNIPLLRTLIFDVSGAVLWVGLYGSM